MSFFRYILLISICFLAFSCNQAKTSNHEKISLDTVINFNSDNLDTLDYQTKLSFSGIVSISKFGNPGEEYKEVDSLPNKAFILEVKSPRSFYYRDNMDSLSYLFYKEYDQFQLSSRDDATYAKLNNLVGKNINLEGTIFQGLTMHYIRDLVIDINKLK